MSLIAQTIVRWGLSIFSRLWGWLARAPSWFWVPSACRTNLLHEKITGEIISQHIFGDNIACLNAGHLSFSGITSVTCTKHCVNKLLNLCVSKKSEGFAEATR